MAQRFDPVVFDPALFDPGAASSVTPPSLTPAIMYMAADVSACGTPNDNAGADKAKWQDLSGNGNDGTLTGFSAWDGATDGWTSDPALKFAGAQYVACPDIGAAEDQTFTYEAWISGLTGTGTYYAVGEGNSANNTPYVGLRISGGVLTGRVSNDVASVVTALTATAVNDGALHHVVFTCGATMNLYVDGIDRTTGGPYTPPGGAVTLNTTTLGVLKQTSLLAYFPGSILAARIYPRALSSFEVAQNFAAGPNGKGYVTDGLLLDLNAARAIRISDWPSALPSGDLDTIKSLGVNVVQNYSCNPTRTDADVEEWLDALEAADLCALLCTRELAAYVVKDRANKTLSEAELFALKTWVARWQEHPAVWGWYTDDEAGAPYPVAARQQVYDAIKAQHPAGTVVECDYVVSAGYSGDVHDLWLFDAYPYQYSGAVAYGCIDPATGEVNPERERRALDAWEDSVRGAVRQLDAGDAFGLVLQAFGAQSAGQTLAMPPTGAMAKFLSRMHTGGWTANGVAFFTWHSPNWTGAGEF